MADHEQPGTLRGSADPDAMARLFERYADRIWRLAVGMLGDADDAEDLVQEVFVRALARGGDFEGRSSPGTWLYRVAHNACVDRLRSRRRAPATRSLDDDAPFMPASFADWSAAADRLLLEDEARAALDAALATLPETSRAVFLLRDVEGLSTTDAAEALGVTTGAAKVRLHRARLLLRERLAGYFSETP